MVINLHEIEETFHLPYREYFLTEEERSMSYCDTIYPTKRTVCHKQTSVERWIQSSTRRSSSRDKEEQVDSDIWKTAG